MGNESSSAYENDLDRFDGIETLGYRVLGVQPNSPASSAGLVSFFDFLVGANGKMLLGSGEHLKEGEEYDDVDFPALLRDNIGTEIELLVWNIKSQTQRLVTLTPRSDWGGTGLLGVTIRLDDYAGADERLIRVLSVEHNSPAAIAGLAPTTDYLLGTTMLSFDDDMALAAVLEAHADRVVELYVYNTDSDVVRVVTLMPTLSWGGRGLLGAEVGTGYLHRLPHGCRGTIGTSVERKVRTGARPTEFQDVPATPGNGTGGAHHHTREELVDLTALTDTVAGTAIHMEPQMEMEPDPEQESPRVGENAKHVGSVQQPTGDGERELPRPVGATYEPAPDPPGEHSSHGPTPTVASGGGSTDATTAAAPAVPAEKNVATAQEQAATAAAAAVLTASGAASQADAASLFSGPPPAAPPKAGEAPKQEQHQQPSQEPASEDRSALSPAPAIVQAPPANPVPPMAPPPANPVPAMAPPPANPPLAMAPPPPSASPSMMAPPPPLQNHAPPMMAPPQQNAAAGMQPPQYPPAYSVPGPMPSSGGGGGAVVTPPPPPPPPPQGMTVGMSGGAAAGTSYGSPFMPPPPMSHLAAAPSASRPQGNGEVDLR